MAFSTCFVQTETVGITMKLFLGVYELHIDKIEFSRDDSSAGKLLQIESLALYFGHKSGHKADH